MNQKLKNINKNQSENEFIHHSLLQNNVLARG